MVFTRPKTFKLCKIRARLSWTVSWSGLLLLLLGNVAKEKMTHVLNRFSDQSCSREPIRVNDSALVLAPPAGVHDTRHPAGHEGGARQRQSSPVCATTNIRKEQNKDICINRELIMSYQGKKNIPKITVSWHIHIHIF